MNKDDWTYEEEQAYQSWLAEQLDTDKGR